MKDGIPAHVGCRGIVFVLAIALSVVMSPAYCQAQNITLLVQQTPFEGGAVTPLAGAHHFEQNQEITLTATPNEGYEFLYWLGDVSNQESTNTTVQLDKPKIVVAVFEPIRDSIDVSSLSGGGGGGGGLISNPVTIGQPASISGTGSKKPKQTAYAPSSEDPPVIPEPATALLLTLGSLFTFTKRRRKNVNPA